MQSIGRRRHPRHRRRAIPDSLEVGGSGTGFLDQRIDPGKRRTVGPAPEDETGAQAGAIEDSRSS